MTFASLIAGVLKFFNALADIIRSNRDIELGRLRENEKKQHKANSDLRDAIDRADSGRVPDSEIIRKD